MKLQTEKNTGLKSLADLKVIKRDGTETPFYAYKLNLIFKSLDADWATQQSVCQALSQAFKDQASATTVEIAETFVDGTTIWQRATLNTANRMKKPLPRPLIP